MRLACLRIGADTWLTQPIITSSTSAVRTIDPVMCSSA